MLLQFIQCLGALLQFLQLGSIALSQFFQLVRILLLKLLNSSYALFG